MNVDMNDNGELAVSNTNLVIVKDDLVNEGVIILIISLLQYSNVILFNLLCKEIKSAVIPSEIINLTKVIVNDCIL
ncbi:hypothetical protein RhiirC2_751564 [Rhizophagus irregularis]|uniref:Uncharacterized protein n=1 Tax=Rhizophagus irregularis TaxID=588596 RepID=A0A2N1N0V7_9GLOM|nr:hypothetical protein RhiirC2_751564 [Rhizophagus irregularis]